MRKRESKNERCSFTAGSENICTFEIMSKNRYITESNNEIAEIQNISSELDLAVTVDKKWLFRDNIPNRMPQQKEIFD